MSELQFPLPVGHELPEGTVVDVTVTAYKVRRAVDAFECKACGRTHHWCRCAEFVFVPFTAVHPRPAVMPLVTFG